MGVTLRVDKIAILFDAMQNCSTPFCRGESFVLSVDPDEYISTKEL